MTESVEPRRAVFIAGNGHSGSTLLLLLLGAHRRLVGLGDVAASIRQNTVAPDRFLVAPCSCGRSVAECEFWGPAAAALPGDSFLAESYRVVTTSFQDVFGPDRILVDSSRNILPLQALRDTGLDVTVVHLLRDVRSWTVSMRDREARRRRLGPRELARRHGWRGLSRWVPRPPSYYFRYWYRQNREFRTQLLGMGVPVIRLGYEELATAPRPILTGLCSDLGLQFAEDMLVPGRSNSHIVLGNDMRLERAKLDSIVYDSRWLTRQDWMRPARICRRIMRYNAAEVYSNTARLP